MHQPANPEAFRTMEEVDEYRSGETIECLICHRQFQALSSHIQLMHNMNVSEYHLRFGIPYQLSLASAKVRREASARVLPQSLAALQEYRPKSAGPGAHGPYRPTVPLVVEIYREACKKAHASAHNIVTRSCVYCGAERQVIAIADPKKVKCPTCGPMTYKRMSYWRHKDSPLPPPLDAAALALFRAPFQNHEDLERYLSGNTIVCLICGQHCHRLVTHMRKAHHLSLADYRRRFHIPPGRSLASAASRAIRKKLAVPPRLEDAA